MLTYADVRWVDGVHDPDKWDYIVANVGHHAAAGTIISQPSSSGTKISEPSTYD